MKEWFGKLLKMARSNISLTLIIIAALMVELVSVVQYNYVRDLLRNKLEQRAEMELVAKGEIIDNMLDDAEVTMAEHVWDIQANLGNPDAMFGVTERLIMTNPHVVGGCIAFVPDYYPEKGRLFEPYAYKEDGTVKVEQIATEQHNYTDHPAYQKVVATRKEFWSDPYIYGDKSEEYLTTYSFPLVDKKDRMAAVVGLDINLSWLGDTLNAEMAHPSSFGLMLTGKGKLVAGPPARHVKQNDVNSIVKVINDSTVERRRTPNGKYWVKEFIDPEDHEKAYVYFLQMDGNPYWQIAIVNYDSEVYEPLYRMRSRNMFMILAGLFVMFFIINRFARNEKRLHQANIDQARIGSELRIAKTIQMEMLPKTFPPYPDRNDIDIYGSLVPAKEVGGDLFDFFIRNEKLFFCIGDVSGKGVPSAMVMSVIRTLFRMVTRSESNPALIMKMLNRELCRNNETNMFVTFFIGILDLPTGHLYYCNAGHDNPVLIGEQTEKLEAKANLPLGVFDNFAYQMHDSMLPTDTTIFLYTDGLTEAKNPHRQQFTRKRMMQVLEHCRQRKLVAAQPLVGEIARQVHLFAKDAEQSDDLTLLAIRYQRKKETYVLEDTITLKNNVGQIDLLSDFSKTVFSRLKMNRKEANGMRLAVEEAVVNVISYAYPEDETGDIVVQAKSDGRQVQFVIIDSGAAFDPTKIQRANTTMAAEERPIGGLGLFLVRKMVDSINYERVEGKNVLTLRKKYQTE